MQAVDAAAGVLSTLASLPAAIHATVGKLYERNDLTEDNKQRLLRVKRRFAAARQLSSKLQPLAAHGAVVVAILREHGNNLEDDCRVLQRWEKQIESARVTDRVKRMNQILDRCETHLDEFFEFLTDNVSPTLQPPAYIPRNNVPVNPPRLTLDYSTTHTAEGKLKEAVLDHGESRIVAFVATGKGGVGKTCALRGLAEDQQIIDHFPGGTLYIQLGNDSKLADVAEGVAKIVERTGAPTLAEKIRLTETLQQACEQASDWFYGQKCLFLVDDIWRVNGIDSNVFDVLASMVNKTSRLVYTTRDRHFLGRAHKVIEFMEKETDGQLARRMLLTHAGFGAEHELEGNNKTAFEAILLDCQGLPLAFGIAGGAVLKQSRRKCAGRQQDAWSDFYDDMKRKSKRSKFLESQAEQYGALRRIVDVSLEVLEKQYGIGKYRRLFRALCVLRKQQSAPLSMLQRLWGFESLEETESVAEVMNDVSVVQMSDEDGIIFIRLHDLMLDIALDESSKRFETRGFFVSIVRNYVLFQHKGGVPTHDCVRSDEKRSGTVRDHAVQVAVSSSKHLGNRSEAGMLVEPGSNTFSEWLMIEWWKMEDDGYLQNNLCRMLREAGCTDTLLWLLSQPQWIVLRFLNGGIYFIEEDLQLGKSVLSRTLSSDRDHQEHLEVVGKAVRLSSMFVNENPREVWFQLYGRLLWHASQNEWTKAFIGRIEGCAPRPWAKASMGILQQASKGVLEIIRSRGRVLCSRLEEEDVWFVWEDEDENMGVARYNTTTGFLKSTDIILPPIHGAEGSQSTAIVRDVAFLNEENSIVGVDDRLRVIVWSRETGKVRRIVKCEAQHNEDGVKFDKAKAKRWFCGMVSSCLGPSEFDGEQKSASSEERLLVIALTANGTVVACESEEHEIQLFDTECGKALGKPLRGHRGDVKCITMSADRSRIASGSFDRTVRIWDVQSGEQIGQPLRGHTDSVRCIAMSGDDSRLISGSCDETVRVWDARSGEAVGPPLRGHTGEVWCVAVSGDGSRIVSGSWDKTVRVWDAQSDEAVGQPLRGHTVAVCCVIMSTDGNRIVSGSWDKTVRVWDWRSGEALTEAVGQRVGGHTGEVRCVSMSRDGNVLVSGSDDKTVRVWDWRSGEAVGAPLRGHTDVVWCVTMSSDCSRIVSGSEDMTVRVWDTRTGQAVGTALQHDEAVSRVAVDAGCSRIVSIGSWTGVGRLWDVGREECVLTSADAGWQSALDALCLSWSEGIEWHPDGRQVTADDEGGRATVLGTCEGNVQNVRGGDCFWTARFDCWCRVVR